MEYKIRQHIIDSLSLLDKFIISNADCRVVFTYFVSMKNLGNLKVLFAVTIFVSFSFSEDKKAKGIQFFNGSFSAALTEAKKTEKPLFIDVYANWCGPCKQLKRSTFKDHEVGNYFNKNFVCVGIDGETDEGRGVRDFYNIHSYPTLLITDANGKLLTRAEGFMKPYILINFGKRIVP